MSHGKQFTLYSHRTGANGWKAAMVLEELDLSYETIYLDFNTKEHKALSYTKLNPNGRVPALIDHHNDDFTVWESSAIMIYLVEKYDIEHKISVPNSDAKGKISQLQWLFFQASDQGLYFWLLMYDPEKNPSIIERYQKEALRVLGVLNDVLSTRDWLVGGKATIADYSFVTWNNTLSFLLASQNFDFEKDFPAVHAWHQRLLACEGVKKALAVQAELSKN